MCVKPLRVGWQRGTSVRSHETCRHQPTTIRADFAHGAPDESGYHLAKLPQRPGERIRRERSPGGGTRLRQGLRTR